MVYKIRGILVPKLRQHISSRQAANENHTVTTRKNHNIPIRRFKANAYKKKPVDYGVTKKPFSRRGPCRIGMAKFCQRAKIYQEPLARYPIYPGIDKPPISTYVTNWRWNVEMKKTPERGFDPRIRGVGLDGFWQTYEPGFGEIHMALREGPTVANTTGQKSKDIE